MVTKRVAFAEPVWGLRARSKVALSSLARQNLGVRGCPRRESESLADLLLAHRLPAEVLGGEVQGGDSRLQLAPPLRTLIQLLRDEGVRLGLLHPRQPVKCDREPAELTSPQKIG
jgi:hypothetical protein